MKALNLGDIRRAHFIGIGGIGMSALARLFLHEGKRVSGSDRSESRVTDDLKREGVTLFPTQVAGNIADDIDLVIYTDAMPKDHEELVAARRLRIPTMSYFEALGEVANRYYLIAVAGTHGKTTTTAMLIDVFEAAGLDPTAVVGSLRAKTKSNFRAGKGKYFIVEADEYERHFLNFTPDLLIITNIEADHLDYYEDLTDVQSAFRALVAQVREDGAVVCNPKDANVALVIAGFQGTLVDYTSSLDPLVPLQVIGVHNYQNAAAAIAAADVVGVTKAAAKEALAGFTGTWRRFEFLGTMPRGARLFDDYAHHPTEIRATLKAAREHFRDKKIIVAFHPHLYSRTKLLFDDFARAFGDASDVVVAPIFAAREKDDGSVSSDMLAEAIARAGTPACALPSFADIVAYIKEKDANDVVVLSMGAGDIYTIAKDLL